MKLILPQITVGPPLLARDVPVFPLYLDAPSEPPLDYLLAAEARKIGALSVEAVKAVREPSHFQVGNDGNKPILLLWREMLKCRQARLRTSVLIAPKTLVTIPPWLVRPYHRLDREGSYRKRAVGIVVVDQFFLLNLFDQESTCRRAWRRLLHTPHHWSERRIHHSIYNIRCLWNGVCDATWEPMDTVGAGQAWRGREEELKGWALTLGDTLVHLQVAAPCWAEKTKKEKRKGVGRIPTPPGLRRGPADERPLWLPFTDQ
jgi:hypothetical protein